VHTFQTQTHGFAGPNNMGIVGLIDDIICLLRYVEDAVSQLLHVIAQNVQSVKRSFDCTEPP
jgi:hypothetical protein